MSRLTAEQRASVRADLARWRRPGWHWQNDSIRDLPMLLADAHRMRSIGPDFLAAAIEYRAAYYRWRKTGSVRMPCTDYFPGLEPKDVEVAA